MSDLCWLMLTHLGHFLTCVDSCWLVSDSCWLVLDSCRTSVDSCWFVLTRVRLVLIRVDSCQTHVDSCWLVSDSCLFVLYSCIRIDLICFVKVSLLLLKSYNIKVLVTFRFIIKKLAHIKWGVIIPSSLRLLLKVWIWSRCQNRKCLSPWWRIISF